MTRQSDDGRGPVYANWGTEFEVLGRHDLARMEFLRAVERTEPSVLQRLFSIAQAHGLLSLTRRDVHGGWAGVEGAPDIRLYHIKPATIPVYRGRSNMDALLVVAGVVGVWAYEGGLSRSPQFNPFVEENISGEGATHDGPPAEVLANDFELWLLEIVVDTIHEWAVSGSDEPLHWHIDDLMRTRDSAEQPLLLSLAGWSPLRETRKDFNQRVRTEFESNLAAYVRAIEARYPSTSQAPTAPTFSQLGTGPHVSMYQRQHPPVTSVPARFNPKHFDWLVMFQIHRRSWKTIAAEHSEEIEARAVKSAVHIAAKAVVGSDYKLWLRRAPVGRPRRT